MIPDRLPVAAPVAPPPYSASGAVLSTSSETDRVPDIPAVPPHGFAAPSGTSTDPSYDYSTRQQSSWRTSTVADIRSSSSAWRPSPAVDSSSTSYFDSRPPLDRISGETLSYVLIIPPHAQPDMLAYPEPKKLWLAQDLTELDWATFLSYLLPLQRDAPSPQDDAGGAALNGAGSYPANVPIVKKPVLPTGMDRKTEQGTNGAPSSPDAATPTESERQRRERIGHIAAHWNQAFFGPRRLHVDVDVLSYSSVPLIPDTANDVATFSQGRSDLGPESLPHTPPSSVSQVLVPSVNDATGTWHASQPQSPSSTLPRPPGLATTPTPQYSKRVIAGLPDDLEDGDLRELRGAFAKVLLSSRSREETATALQELNRELQTQRQTMAKQLKVDAKLTQKKIKGMKNQYKLDRRAEEKRLKTADKTHKAELKALRKSRKDLEKRQKEVHKEAKAFKANAKKAGKKKGEDPVPDQGWLETSIESKRVS